MKKFFVLTFLLFVGGWVAYAQSPQTGNITASGSTCAVTNACVVAQIPANFGSVSVGVSGTYSGTLQFEVNQVQANGTTVTSSVNCYPPNSTSAATSTTSTGLWTCAVVGMQSFDVRSSSYSSGTAAISIGISNNISVSSLTAGGGGGGSGTVTGVLGTANQVSVTNSTTTPTVSLPTAITLPGSMLIQPASDGTEFTVKNSAGTTTVMAVNTTSGGNVLTLTPPAGGGFDLVDSSAYMGNVIVNGTLTGTASKATALASVTGYSVYGSGASAGSWLTPTANGQCLMSGASSYATTTPSFQSCPSSGTSALSGVTAATGGNTIASGNNVSQIWNWAMTSASSTAFTFGETTAATSTGTNYILAAKTLAGSTASPLNVVNSLTGSQTLCTVCIFPTWNTSAVADAAIFMNVTNTASGTGSLLADYQVGGTSEWKVDKAGNETVAGSIGTGTAPTACGTATGCLAQTEGSTASTPTSGQDVMRANSTTHWFECSLNNGSEVACNPALPSSSTNGDIVSWSGTAGTTLADSGVLAANLVHYSATVTTNSGTSVGSTTLCSSTNCPAGTYMVNVYIDVTTACGTSGTYIVNLIYTDDQGSKTVPVNINGSGTVPATGTLTTTSTANYGENSQVIRLTSGNLNYSTTATACGTAGPMVGKLYLSAVPVM